MADLMNRITQQIVQGVDAEHFLSEIEDAANWIKHEAETVMEAVADAILPADAASHMPEVETKTYGDGTSATGPAPLPDQSPAEQEAATTDKEAE